MFYVFMFFTLLCVRFYNKKYSTNQHVVRDWLKVKQLHAGCQTSAADRTMPVLLTSTDSVLLNLWTS